MIPALLAAALLFALATAAPAAAAAGPGDDPVLWRRWALVDPGSGHEGTEPAALDMPLREPSRLKPGCCPLEEWTVDGAPSSRPVVRHEPEDAGAFPTWLREPA